MGLKILNLQQGTGEWLSHRDACLNASDAPAMAGVSKYQTRSELVRQKATGITKEHDAGTLARFRAGHEAEASIRPHAEYIVGEPLYPVTGENEIDGMRLSASSDGLTMDGEVGFEHKIWNEDIAASVRNGIVPESHIWQIVHQHAVFGLRRTLFVVSDGTPEKCVYCWVEVSDEQIERLMAGWKQFAEDVKNYQHVEEKPNAVAEVIPSLPAVFVQVEGRVLTGDMRAHRATVSKWVQALPNVFETDQDFANGVQAMKECTIAEDGLSALLQQILGQMTTVDEVIRLINESKAEIAAARIRIKKKVDAEKENRKIQIVTQARQAIEDHITMLNKRIGGNWMPAASVAPFAEAIKSLKSIDSMREKVGNALRDMMLEASLVADRIEANQILLNGSDRSWSFLFPDFAAVCTKPTDDFEALLSMRITNHRAAEEKRLEAERMKIRAEEQEKAEREANAKVLADAVAALEKEQWEADFKAAERARDEADALAHGFGVNRTIDTPEVAEKKNVQAMAILDVFNQDARKATDIPADDGKTLKLGEISSRLGFTITADFMAQLGFQPVATEKSAKLYRASDFGRICVAIINHIQSAMRSAQMAA